MVQNSDRVTITGNECRSLARYMKTAPAISVFGSGRVTIANNRFDDTPHSALQAEWIDGLIVKGNKSGKIEEKKDVPASTNFEHIRNAEIAD